MTEDAETSRKSTKILDRIPRAVELLLAGRTYAEVANELQISPSTLYQWRQRPEFQAQFAEARAATREGLTGQLADASTRAVRALVSIAEDPGTPPDVRLSAIAEILDRCAPASTGEEPDGSAKRGGPVVQVVIGDREQAKAWLREHRAAKDGGQG